MIVENCGDLCTVIYVGNTNKANAVAFNAVHIVFAVHRVVELPRKIKLDSKLRKIIKCSRTGFKRLHCVDIQQPIESNCLNSAVAAACNEVNSF